jgi:hypothetical protein
MIPRLKILQTKSRHGIDLPLNTRRTVDGQTVEVWGLIKKQVNNQAVIQWWIVNLVEEHKHTPPWRLT